MKKHDSVLVFGATGSCGRAVVERGLARGLRMTAYVRNEAKALDLFGPDRDNLDIVVGELTNSEVIYKLLAEHDAVISCLSSFEAPHNRMSLLVRSLVDFVKKSGKDDLRLIVYGLCSVEADGDWISHGIQNVLRLVSPGKFGPAIQDHKALARILSATSIDYTLFQTATMIEKAIGSPYRSGSPEDCPGVRLWDRWGVLDAADVCLDSLAEPSLKRLQMRYLS